MVIEKHDKGQKINNRMIKDFRIVSMEKLIITKCISL